MLAKLEILLINNNRKNIINSFSIIIVLMKAKQKSLIELPTRDCKSIQKLVTFLLQFLHILVHQCKFLLYKDCV